MFLNLTCFALLNIFRFRLMSLHLITRQSTKKVDVYWHWQCNRHTNGEGVSRHTGQHTIIHSFLCRVVFLPHLKWPFSSFWRFWHCCRSHARKLSKSNYACLNLWGGGGGGWCIEKEIRERERTYRADAQLIHIHFKPKIIWLSIFFFQILQWPLKK